MSGLANPESVGIVVTIQGLTVFSVVMSTWTLMYFYSPSTSLRLRYPRLNTMYLKTESFIQHRINKLPYFLQNHPNINWNRIVTSGAEAWALRQFLLPIYYPGGFALGVYGANKYSHWRWPDKYKHKHEYKYKYSSHFETDNEIEIEIMNDGDIEKQVSTGMDMDDSCKYNNNTEYNYNDSKIDNLVDTEGNDVYQTKNVGSY